MVIVMVMVNGFEKLNFYKISMNDLNPFSNQNTTLLDMAINDNEGSR